jgi:hypothetical protein
MFVAVASGSPNEVFTSPRWQWGEIGLVEAVEKLYGIIQANPIPKAATQEQVNLGIETNVFVNPTHRATEADFGVTQAVERGEQIAPPSLMDDFVVSPDEVLKLNKIGNMIHITGRLIFTGDPFSILTQGMFGFVELPDSIRPAHIGNNTGTITVRTGNHFTVVNANISDGFSPGTPRRFIGISHIPVENLGEAMRVIYLRAGNSPVFFDLDVRYPV